MPSKPAELAKRLLSIVASAQGDDLERAEAAFRNCSNAELDGQYGQSGRTRRQILDEYRQRRAEDKELLAFTKALLEVADAK